MPARERQQPTGHGAAAPAFAASPPYARGRHRTGFEPAAPLGLCVFAGFAGSPPLCARETPDSAQDGTDSAA